MVEKITFEKMMKYWNDKNDSKAIVGSWFSKEEIEEWKKSGKFKILKEIVLDTEKKIGTIQFACGHEENKTTLSFRGGIKGRNQLDIILKVIKYMLHTDKEDKKLSVEELKNQAKNFDIFGLGEPAGVNAACPLF